MNRIASRKMFAGIVVPMAIFAILLEVVAVQAQGPKPFTPRAAPGTGFTYQGLLKQNGSPVTGSCNSSFKLFDAISGGSQKGLTHTPVLTVTNGLFTTQLDFGNQFTGDARWLDVTVDCGRGAVTLTPRQALTAVPYAIALRGFRTEPNAISPNIIGGHISNTIQPFTAGSTILGGGDANGPNIVDANYSVIAGGRNNNLLNDDAFIGGGMSNTISGFSDDSFIGGGVSNTIGGSRTFDSFIGGGFNNSAGGLETVIGGGERNTANGDYSFIGGGVHNTANGDHAVIVGGSGNSASGPFSVIPGGSQNQANGYYSFAGGIGARAFHQGTFVWADAALVPLTSTVDNQFLVRATGGITLYTNSAATVGAALAPGSGSWSVASDRSAKTNFRSVDEREVLARLASMPVETWNYKTQDAAIRHIGPMAQDFKTAFGMGENDTSISTVDAQGVALAAIQGLNQVVQEKDAEIAAQQKQLDNLTQRVAALEQSKGANSADSSWLDLRTFVFGLLLASLAGYQLRRERNHSSR